MKNQFDKHEIDYIKIYQEKGFVSNFYFKDKKFRNAETKVVFEPEDLFIVAEHRYEGMSNPEDMSILYVIQTKNGDQGTFLMGYGPNSDLELAEFFKKIPKTNITNDLNIDL
ncbi:hypothetical protein [Flavobacterium sp. UMI-01]|uniref:hypothetical protein n=1 Tax=Flavobacterium sp. UMI-01 TaxID=1441053 RepID=UPI001C7DD138|nr:hypothetical protein [Flavobacterium sp. UMI-01]